MQSNAHGKKEQDLSVSFGQSRATIDKRRKRFRSHDTQKHKNIEAMYCRSGQSKSNTWIYQQNGGQQREINNHKFV